MFFKSRRYYSWQKTVVVFFVAYFCTFSWRPAMAALRDHIGIFQAGFELEISPRYFARLVDDLDWDKIPQQRYDNIYDDTINLLYRDYPLNNQNFFDIIPPDLLSELTAGLNLEIAPLDIVENNIIINQVPSFSEQKKNNEIQLVSNFSGEHQVSDTEPVILSSSSPASPIESIEKQFVVPRLYGNSHKNHGVTQSKDWKILNERWNALPTDVKRAAGKLKYGSRLVRAKLAIRWIPKARDYHQKLIQLRDDLPEKIRNIYRNLRFFRDMEGMEFHQIEPEKNIMQFRQALRNFAKYVGVELFLDNPFIGLLNLSGLKGNSLHIHISSIDAAPPFDRKVVEGYNLLLLLQAINADRGQNVLRPGGYTQFSEITMPGLLKLIGDNRIELRYFTRGFEQTLDFLFTHLRLPPAEALKSLASEIKIEFEKGALQWLVQFESETLWNTSLLRKSLLQTYSFAEILQLKGALGLPITPIEYIIERLELNLLAPELLDILKPSAADDKPLLIHYIKEYLDKRKINAYSSDRVVVMLLLQGAHSWHTKAYLAAPNLGAKSRSHLMLSLAAMIENNYCTQTNMHECIFLAYQILGDDNQTNLLFINKIFLHSTGPRQLLKEMILANPAPFNKSLSHYVVNRSVLATSIAQEKSLLIFLAEFAQESAAIDDGIRNLFDKMIVDYSLEYSEDVMKEDFFAIEDQLMALREQGKTRLYDIFIEKKETFLKNSGCLKLVRHF